MDSIPPLPTLFERFGLALFLGFLIGLEREREKTRVFAGMRTFALISLLGSVTAFLSGQFADNLFVWGFIGILGFALASYFRNPKKSDIGITTGVAVVLAYVLGGMVFWDLFAAAAALTVATVFLLAFKPDLRAFAAHISREDIRAGLEFAVVWVVVLPLLPDRAYGPFDVLNPREIWIFVVLVAGLNLAGYLLSQFMDAQRSIGLIGLLGSVLSSTAVTFEMARRSRSQEEQNYAPLFAVAIAIASTGMFIRAIVLAYVINPGVGRALVWPMLASGLAGMASVLALWRHATRLESVGGPEKRAQRSPFALRPALQFGLLFAVVLFVSKAAQVTLGDTGAYLSSALAGLAGTDAPTLSLAKLAGSGLSVQVAARSITLATASNMLLKGMAAAALGAGEVRRWVLPVFGAVAAVGLVVAFLVI
jgi:uncharacterized membrane protein (DUF4010 family)